MRELSQLSRISTTPIAKIENGHSETPHVQTLERLRDVLRGQGVEFTPGGWVRHGGDHVHQGDGQHQGGEQERARGEPGTVIERGLALARQLVHVLERGEW